MNSNKVYSYGKQSISWGDIWEVVKSLRSPYLTQGPKVKEFEQVLCDYTGAKYCVAVSNGTAALHLAVLSLGIKSGDEVITSPITFVASANSVLYAGGTVKFADIDPKTANIDPKEIEKIVNCNMQNLSPFALPCRPKPKGEGWSEVRSTKSNGCERDILPLDYRTGTNDKTSCMVKALIPVHYAGQSCDMEKIAEIAKKNNLFVIEDAAHAIGSEYKGVKVGSCKYSDLTTFSFHPVKTITTGEGGAITTNNKDLYERLLLLRTHGITRDPNLFTQNDGPWYHEQHVLGFNYRIPDFACALGISQLKRLDIFVKRRREIVAFYKYIQTF